MLGHLAADERAARLLATLGYARNDLGHRFGLEFAHGNVVEEEQRLGTGCQDIVRAHGDQIDAHRIVLARQLGHLELRAHAVGPRYEDGVGHVLRRCDGEQAPESADIADDLVAIGFMNGTLDRIDGSCALGGIDAGLRVGRGVLRPARHGGGVVPLDGAYGDSLCHLISL